MMKSRLVEKFRGNSHIFLSLAREQQQMHPGARAEKDIFHRFVFNYRVFFHIFDEKNKFVQIRSLLTESSSAL